MRKVEMISKEQFESAAPYDKGYAVYMRGCWESEPNIPKKYTPKKSDKSEYDRGERAAIIEVIDTEG